MSGLDPSRALIFSLQALGADLISRDFVMRELPWSMNVTGEQQQIDVQRMRDNLNASMSGLANAIPEMVAQGQDPSELAMKMAEVIKERQKGTQIEEAVTKVFAPAPAPAPQVAPGVPPMAPVEQAVPPAPAAAAPGAPQPGQPEQPPAGLQELLSQLG
jgi:N-methylhydantoinase A/oxoprolinase/acetone carboxylase beta subunit